MVFMGACSPPNFPEDPLLSPVDDLPEPKIVPLAPILDTEDRPNIDPTPDLEQRGEALRDRAEEIRNGQT